MTLYVRPTPATVGTQFGLSLYAKTHADVVRVLMPPTPVRPHAVDLLLCGHHYRVSRRALEAARAAVRELPGTPDDVAAWIDVHRPAALAGR